MQDSWHSLLGAKVVAAMLMFATVSGILMALFLNTAGGAWDNAKKYIETGALGGKGSDSHKAAVTAQVEKCIDPNYSDEPALQNAWVDPLMDYSLDKAWLRQPYVTMSDAKPTAHVG
ncbi:hypothetical protein E3N88_37270 [Mikania micrantha]|uniref:H(+)-exporting diphosphatase n=1 Tax=Mikania micrantha TaxID=192012 RepID=A0A5N6M5Y2_9ASTR|nr:hypothetical protein E3N88_37270 [Mikania micrantha]